MSDHRDWGKIARGAAREAQSAAKNLQNKTKETGSKINEATRTARRTAEGVALGVAIGASAQYAAMKEGWADMAGANQVMAKADQIPNPADGPRKEAEGAKKVSDGIQTWGEVRAQRNRPGPSSQNPRNRDERRHPDKPALTPRPWRPNQQSEIRRTVNDQAAKLRHGKGLNR